MERTTADGNEADTSMLSTSQSDTSMETDERAAPQMAVDTPTSSSFENPAPAIESNTAAANTSSDMANTNTDTSLTTNNVPPAEAASAAASAHEESGAAAASDSTTPISNTVDDAAAAGGDSTSDKPILVVHPMEKQAPIKISEEDAKWHTVGIYTGLNATVNSYVDNSAWTSAGMATPLLPNDAVPDLSKFQRINLEPGTAYRFRLRAINSVGPSEWSEISSFKTCLPGFPGAPSAIKISKSSEGAHLTWEPPPSCQNSNEIVEYSVYLAVKPGREKDNAKGGRTPAQLAFVRVYVGAANQCTVAHSSLGAAHVDCSNKPAIIFRIAARNEKGYGPATQVRWLQDPVQTALASVAAGGTNTAMGSIRYIKPELGGGGGVSPTKRLKMGSGGGGGGVGGRGMLPPSDN